VDEATVTEAQADLAQLEALDQTQEREKTEAQQAARVRNDACRPYADGRADVQPFARVALMLVIEPCGDLMAPTGWSAERPVRVPTGDRA
jgi:hypothetical protein